MAQGVTPAHMGLAPFRLIFYLSVKEKMPMLGTHNENNACFSVHNHGSQISEDIFEKVSNQSFSAKNKNRLKEKSYGLGLLIVKEIVERHSGEIKISSSPESGTTFTIKLPKN